MDKEKNRYCRACDYAISAKEYWSSNTAPVCPRCGCSMFYSYGSKVHKMRWDAYMRGIAKGNPVSPEPADSLTVVVGGDSYSVAHGSVLEISPGEPVQIDGKDADAKD